LVPAVDIVTQENYITDSPFFVFDEAEFVVKKRDVHQLISAHSKDVNHKLIIL
jgi:hypothetical protein